MEANVLHLIDQVRSIAVEGLSYATNSYDAARYQELLRLCSNEYSTMTGIPAEQIRNLFLREAGCITPKLGVDVAVLNESGGLLVLRRADDFTWCLPCGWVDVGENPLATSTREVYEEAGIKTEPLGYIAISSKGPEIYPKIVHQVNILVAMKPVPDEILVRLSHEHSESRWITDGSAVKWHPGHERLFQFAMDFFKSGIYIPHIR